MATVRPSGTTKKNCVVLVDRDYECEHASVGTYQRRLHASHRGETLAGDKVVSSGSDRHFVKGEPSPSYRPLQILPYFRSKPIHCWSRQSTGSGNIVGMASRARTRPATEAIHHVVLE